MSITARPLEAWITEAVLQRLDSSEMADALEGQTRDDEQATAFTSRCRWTRPDWPSSR